jgi:hypothetical protein
MELSWRQSTATSRQGLLIPRSLTGSVASTNLSRAEASALGLVQLGRHVPPHLGIC